MMIKEKNYFGKCWICGLTANSGEHVYKKTDLIREFNDQFKQKERISRIIGEEEIFIQGPNSKKVKFERCLCEKCNNDRTQSFDLTYDVFNKYFKENEKSILIKQEINLEDIFGNQWKGEFNKLIKYYAKHVGCVLAFHNIEVLPDIVDCIVKDTDLISVKFNFIVRKDIFELLDFHRMTNNEDMGYLARDPLEGNYSISEKKWFDLTSSYFYRSLQLNYYYSKNPDCRLSNFTLAPKIPMLIWESPFFRKEFVKLKKNYDNVYKL